jgi:hypothetical protein
MALEGSCDDGEPYWAAKYFPTVSRVRIVYFPAYYYDCGASHLFEPFFTYAHYGDSEPIRFDVRFNAAKKHWELVEAEVFLLAHNDNSYQDWFGLEYPVRQLAYPRVWVARDKHAHYQNRVLCTGGGSGNTDDCDRNVVRGRLLIYKARNIGSIHLDHFSEGVTTQDPTYQSGRREYFYQEHEFGGWRLGAGQSSKKATAFSQHLRSGIFELKTLELPCELNCRGPGPNPPSSAALLGTVDGPTQVTAFQTYSWNSVVTGGNAPYQGEWWRSYDGLAFALWGTSSQTGSYNAGKWTALVDRCGNFTLRLKTRSADGQVSTTDYVIGVICPLTVTTSPMTCSLEYIPYPKYLKVAWINGDVGASTEVQILKSSGAWQLVGTASPGVTQYFYTLGSQTGLFYARVRHVKAGYGPSNYCDAGARTVP